MTTFRPYWTFSSIRGALTIVVALGIAGTPLLAAAMMPMPVVLGLALDIVAVYLLLDCSAMLILGLLLPKAAAGKRLYYLQAATSLTVGGLLYAMLADRIPLGALPVLLMIQGAVAAVTEWRVARDTDREYHCLSCYTTVFALVAGTLVMPFVNQMTALGATLAVATWVGLFGVAELSVGGRMLFKEYRLGHPAPAQSVVWQGLMDGALEPLPAMQACVNCEICPAETRCTDYTLPGQLASIAASRVPAVVRTMRASRVLENAQHV